MLAFLALPLLGQAPESWRFSAQVGVCAPLGAWADQAKPSFQLNLASAYQVNTLLELGVDLQFGQGNAVKAGPAGTREFTTFALIPEAFLTLGETKGGMRWYALGGVGMARLSEDRGWRTDLQPSPDGQVTTTNYGGSTLWSTVRPVYQVGLGLSFPMKQYRRLILELRLQRIQTAGLAVTSLPITIGTAW
jgi:hypothetical protein